MKKKVLVVLAIVTLSMSIVTACGSKKVQADENLLEMETEVTEEDSKPVVVNTEEVTGTTENEIETEIIETTESSTFTDKEMEKTKDAKSASDTGKKDTGSNSAKSGTAASGTANNDSSDQTPTDKQTLGDTQKPASASTQVKSNNTEQSQNTQTGNEGQTNHKEQDKQQTGNSEQASTDQNVSSGNEQAQHPEQNNKGYETTTEATTDVITFPDGSTSTSYHPAGSPVEVSREIKYLENGEQIIYIYYSDGSMEVIGSSYDAVDSDTVYQPQP